MNVLDLFSGIGGFSLGLERAGMRTIAFCEVDPVCRQVLRKHWPVVPIFEDVKTLSAKDIHETIDIICGGFPCQDISVAGLGAGLAGERSGLWYEFHRLIKEARPKYVIIENVAALRARGLDEVLRCLSALGYDAEWHCITIKDMTEVRPRRTSPSNLRDQVTWGQTYAEVRQKLWPTPSARDHKGGYIGGRMRNGKVSWDTLDVAVQWTDNQSKDGGTLNPNWVEWLMGFPVGHTDLGS